MNFTTHRQRGIKEGLNVSSGPPTIKACPHPLGCDRPFIIYCRDVADTSKHGGLQNHLQKFGPNEG